MKRKIPFTVVVLLMSLFSACGGGGGGSGSGGQGRTHGTGIRVVNASIDTPPLSLYAGSDVTVLQTARFAGTTNYVSLAKGPVELRLARANSDDTIAGSIPATLEKNTEYTVFVFGSSRNRSLQLSLLTDIVVQPPVGRAFLSALNAYDGESQVEIAVDNTLFATVSYGQSSGFQDIASGPHQFVVRDSRGNTISSITYVISDRSDVTLLIAGSRSLGVSFLPLYTDLD